MSGMDSEQMAELNLQAKLDQLRAMVANVTRGLTGKTIGILRRTRQARGLTRAEEEVLRIFHDKAVPSPRKHPSGAARRAKKRF